MKRNQKRIWLVTVVIIQITLVFALSALSQAKGKVYVNFKQTVLKNGLRVFTVEDHNAPVITLEAHYHVGSRNEKKGLTGINHLLEHVTNLDSNITDDLVTKIGGTLNAGAGRDSTTYFYIFPSNQLNLSLVLESQRMKRFDITKEIIEREKNITRQEGKQRSETTPYGANSILLTKMMFDNFAINSLGDDDLDNVTIKDLQEFYNIYYAPNNAVLVLVGDFKTDKAISRIKELFEEIPRKPEPPPIDMTEPEQKVERRGTREDNLARLPRVDIGYKTVQGNTPDFYALHVLSFALRGGQSSRLYQKLVREKQIANNVGGGMDGSFRGAPWQTSFLISATLRAGAKTENAEPVIYEEIERLKKEPLSDLELQKAKDLAEREYVFGTMSSSRPIAFNLGYFAITYNEPNLINTWLDKLSAVTKEDVRRVANKYLKQTNRSVLITVPKG